MTQASIPELVTRLIVMSDGSADKAAKRLGTSPASLSRWKSGLTRPRKQLRERLSALVDGSADLVEIAERDMSNHRLERLEEAISGTIRSLREEFHRSASVTRRQDALDLVAAFLFAHVVTIDSGGLGIGLHLTAQGEKAVAGLNHFMEEALIRHLPKGASQASDPKQYFTPLIENNELFARRVLEIFDRDANAFRELHQTGRDDLINEVFSRFMSTSFVDEKEMGQYLTPPEVVRFMVELGYKALSQKERECLLECKEGGIILDPSCGVGSFLAESIRFFHARVREKNGSKAATKWLRHFLENRVIGIDKSERMIRLATINLGLFAASVANLEQANGLAREGDEGNRLRKLEGRAQLILTNPPFGATYSGPEIQAYEMGRHRSKAESEVLFIERYIDWLAPSGILVSVVPDSILVNRGSFADLRALLRKQCDVCAIVSLPPMTFSAAGTSTKTSVIVLRKRERSSQNETFFGVAREVGFTVVTRSGQRRRVRSPRNDLPELIATFSHSRVASIGKHRLLSEGDGRWDAPYHIGLPDNVAAALSGGRGHLVTVSDVAKLVDVRVDPRKLNTPRFNYIEISDVSLTTGLVGCKEIPTAEAPSRARKLVRAGDVLVSTVRPERGAVGVVPPSLDGAICSTGFAVLRCGSINPIALAWLLKSDVVRSQMVRNNIGIAYPAISEDTCLSVKLPATHADIEALAASAEFLRSAQDNLEQARRDLANKVSALNAGVASSAELLLQSPNVIDASEPGSVTDVA